MAIPFPKTVRTVDKFGVSLNGNNGNGPLLQPKSVYRFRVLFLGFGRPENQGEPLSLNTNNVSLPSLSHDVVEVHSYNSRAYWAGKHQWSTFSLTVRDTVDNTVTREVGRQMQRQLDHYNQTGFMSATDYKFRCMIQHLTGGHDQALSNWTMEGCFLENVEYSALDYSTSDNATISLTIRPDNVIIEGEGSGGQNTIMTNPGQDPYNTTINR